MSSLSRQIRFSVLVINVTEIPTYLIAHLPWKSTVDAAHLSSHPRAFGSSRPQLTHPPPLINAQNFPLLFCLSFESRSKSAAPRFQTLASSHLPRTLDPKSTTRHPLIAVPDPSLCSRFYADPLVSLFRRPRDLEVSVLVRLELLRQVRVVVCAS